MFTKEHQLNRTKDIRFDDLWYGIIHVSFNIDTGVIQVLRRSL